LGQAEVLGIKGPPRDCSRRAKHNTSVRPFSPWCDERLIFPGKSCKEAAEGVVLSAENSGHVFPDDDGGLFASAKSNRVNCIGYLAEGERQVAPCIVKGPAQAGNAERLAGRAATEHIGRFDLTQPDARWQRGHVA
jgi:hypothetical protein